MEGALLRPFEFLTVVKGIPRKNNKKPTINSFSSFGSSHDENGPALFINREKYGVTTIGGRRLGPSLKDDPLIQFEIQKLQGKIASFSVKQRLDFDRKSTRALFKIAIETIAFFHGPKAISAELRPAINFVRHGKGKFLALAVSDQTDDYASQVWEPRKTAESSWVVCFTLLGIGFYCPVDGSRQSLEEIYSEIHHHKIGAFLVPNS